jgi:hypothetical protein
MHLGRFELHRIHGVKYPVWLSRKGNAVKSHSKSQATIRRDEEARIRLAARNSRSDGEQLKLLEARGAGHCKEAMKIRARIAGLSVKELTESEEAVEALKDHVAKQKSSRPVRKRRNKPASLM